MKMNLEIEDGDVLKGIVNYQFYLIASGMTLKLASLFFLFSITLNLYHASFLSPISSPIT